MVAAEPPGTVDMEVQGDIPAEMEVIRVGLWLEAPRQETPDHLKRWLFWAFLALSCWQEVW